jgi:hypothetical protein
LYEAAVNPESAKDFVRYREIRQAGSGLREQSAEVVGDSPTELAAYVAAEIPKWAPLARQAGVKPD